MSNVIDEKVVEMRFDNKQFEKNVQTSLSTLDKLKQSLKLDGAAKGLENVDKSAKSISLEGLLEGVENLNKRFSAFGIIGMRVLENLTDGVMNLANKTISFLTDSVVQGGINRAMNIENAHFMLQGLLKDEEKVQEIMSQASESVDGTAYSYDSAAKAASQFAASGVEAGDKMRTALRAITGVAAMTNSEYEGISQIFTTVAGNGRLMGDQLLQLSSRGLNAASTLAEYMTKVGDGTKYTEADIRKMVSNGEISFEIFAAAMDDAFGEHAKKANETFTGAMSNVKAALARIGAEFVSPLIEQNGPLIKMFNELRLRINDIKANIIPFAKAFTDGMKKIADSATTFLNKLDLTDYFTAFYNSIEALKNVCKGLWSIIKPIGEAFTEIFPPVTSKRLAEITTNIKELTETFKMNDTVSKNLKNTFKGLFAVLDILKQAFSAVITNLAPLLGSFGKLTSKVLGTTGSFGEWLVQLDETIRKNDFFNNAIKKMTEALKNAVAVLRNFVSQFKEKFNLPGLDEVKKSLKDFISTITSKFKTPGLNLVNSILEKIGKRISQITTAAINAVNTIDKKVAEMKFLQIVQAVWNGIKTVAKEIAKGLGEILGEIAGQLGGGDFSEFLDLLNGGTLVGIGIALSKFFEHFLTVINRAGGMFSNVNKILFNVKNTLITYQAQLKAEILMKIAKAIALLTAAIVVLSFVDSEKLNSSLGAITVMFADLMSSMAIYSRISGKMPGVIKASAAMLGLSTSVLILAVALKKISSLKPKELATGMVGIVGLTGTIVAAAKIMSTGEKTIIKGAGSMMIFSVAVKILASVCKDLSQLGWEELAKGLVGVGALLAEISIFLRTAKFSGKTITTATGIVILSSAIKILASACKDFARMEWGEIGKGLSAVGAVLLEVAAFTKLTSNAKHVISSGVALIALGAAMKIFASALKDMSNLSWEELARGLVGMAGALSAVTLSLKFMPKNMVGIGTGLIAVSSALLIMADALQHMGGMSWEEIAKGLVTLAGSITILAAGLRLMKGTLSGSAAMLVASASLAVLTPVLKSLGNMSWEQIAKGLITIAGAFAIIGVAGLLLKPIVPTILALGASFALLGLGVLGVGAGLMAAATGLIALSGSAIAVAEMIPLLFKKIGEGIIELCKVISSGTPELGEAVKAIVLTIMDVLVETVPVIVDGLLVLIVDILDALVKYTPKIIDDILVFIIEVIDGITARLPELIKSAVNLIMAFFAGVADALSDIDVDTLLKGIVGIGLLSAIMVALSAVASLVPGAMAGVLGMGGVIAELSLVLAAVGLLQQIPGLNWLIGEGGKLLEGIGTAIGKFVGGIVGGLMSGISSEFPQIASDLSAFMENVQPFIKGASKIDANTMNGVKSLAEVILLLTAADILNGLASWLTGGTSIADFGKELAEFGPHFNSYYKSVKGIDGSVIQSSANAAKALAEMANNLPRHGGVVQWFEGENSLSDFADELTDFGPSLKSYADSIKGLNSAVVVESANAAKAISEMANNLPKHGGVVGWFEGENSLSDFADELADFGPSLKLYSDSVKDINGEVVVNSANAAKALAEMANNLPNQGGVLSWFTGDNTLSVFGEELASFGPHLKKYSDSVNGLDADVVIISANAAKTLSEMAANLPDQGGVLSWFTGDNTLSVFGEELAAFGPYLKKYSNSVKGLNSDVVINSANAAKSLAELANNLPDQGGIFSWFTGDKDLATFGESLVVFGENFSKYSGYMKNVNANIVTTTTNAANSIVELQKNLPEDGGWFSNTKTLEDFGSDMAAFGSYFYGYYSNISGINTKKLSDVIDETNNLVAMARGMNDLDTSGMRSFGESLNALAQTGINDFIKAFTNANGKIKDTAKKMLSDFIDAANSKKSELNTTFTNLMQNVLTGINSKAASFTVSGEMLIVELSEGIRSKTGDAANAMVKVLDWVTSQINTKTQSFKTSATTLMINFINGIRAKNFAVQNAVLSIVNFASISIKSKYNAFYNAGFYLTEGFIAGINSNIETVSTTAAAMANAAAEASKIVLDEHSPSKVGYQIGDYFGVAFVNAIGNYEKKSYEAGRDVAYSAKNGLTMAVNKISDAIDNDMDIQPTIRPVVDLSEVTRSVDSINGLFNAQKSIDLASRTSLGINAKAAEIQAGINVNNSDILNEMNNLRNDISSLADVITKMQVIMDTGALVGAIASPINNALGRQAVYERRGN